MGVLYGVAAFVTRHSRSGNAARRIDTVTQVYGHILGIEMVGKHTLDMGNLHIVDIMVAQHLLGHLGACHIAGERHLRIFRKDMLQASLNDISHNTDYDHQQY